ncbi:MAG: hypothetical protein D6767_00745, partial [Candidatus Hydrogenedentota bacterium]
MSAMDYFWYAFKNGWNLAFLGIGILVFMFGWRNIALLPGFLAADILMSFLVSLSPRFRRIVRANLAEEEDRI